MTVAIVRAEKYDRAEIAESLARAFNLLGMDAGNPFTGMIAPGNRVFIKPNWVAHRYRASCSQQYDVYTTITHPYVVEQVALLVDKALDGNGEIIIGDNPSIDADFSALLALAGLEALKSQCKTPVTFLDLRPLVCKDLKDYGIKKKMHPQPGDPLGVSEINLGKQSLLYGFNPKLFRGVFTDREETIYAHSGENQLYGISRSIYDADVFISLPKLKTHHKTGVTLNLKGLVGTMGIKNYLVHWRNGFPNAEGDAYPDFDSWYQDQFRTVKKRGAWHGNDTIWRMVVDLYQCFLRKESQRRFSIIDGILAGERGGPFCPEPKHAHVLLAGNDFLTSDIVAVRLMGFNPLAVPYLKYYLEKKKISFESINVHSEDFDLKNFFSLNNKNLKFKPSKNWEVLSAG